MDKQAAHTLATLMSNDTPVPVKLGLLEKLKAYIKHQNVPSSAISITFEVIHYAICASELAKLGFDLLNVLVKRLTNQGQHGDVALQAPRFYPLLTELLGDVNDLYRVWAIKAFMDFWTVQSSEVNRIMKNALKGGNATMKQSALWWITKMAEENLRRNLRFSPIFHMTAVIECLNDNDGYVKDTAKTSVISIFNNNPLMQYEYSGLLIKLVQKSIVDEIISQLKLGLTGQDALIGKQRHMILSEHGNGGDEHRCKTLEYTSTDKPTLPSSSVDSSSSLASKLPSSIASKPISSVVAKSFNPVATNRSRSSSDASQSSASSAPNSTVPTAPVSVKSSVPAAPKPSSAKSSSKSSFSKPSSSAGSKSSSSDPSKQLSSGASKKSAPVASKPSSSAAPKQFVSTASKSSTSIIPASGTSIYSLPELENDPVEPLVVHSNRELEGIFRDMKPLFEGRETEHNWTPRELSVVTLRKLTNGNAPQAHSNVYISGIRGLLDGILKTATSLRTSSQLKGYHLIQDIAKVAGPNLDSMAEILLQSMIKASGNTKAIAAQGAYTTVNIIFANVPYNVRLLQHISNAMKDKNPKPRECATVWLRTIINKHASHKSVIEHGDGLTIIAKCVKDGLEDSAPSVREGMRPTYWSFWVVWPNEADTIMTGLALTKQKQLLEHEANPNKDAMIMPVPPTNTNSNVISSRTGPSAKPGPSLKEIKEAMAAQKKAKLAGNIERPVSALSSSTPSRPMIARPMTSMGMTVKAASSVSTNMPAQTGILSSAPVRPFRATRKVDTGKSTATDPASTRKLTKDTVASENAVDLSVTKSKSKPTTPINSPSKSRMGNRPAESPLMSSVAKGKRVARDDRSSDENTPPNEYLAYPNKGKTVAKKHNSMDVVITSKHPAISSGGQKIIAPETSSKDEISSPNHFSNSPTKAAEDFTMVLPTLNSFNLHGELPEKLGKGKISFQSARALADATEFSTISNIAVPIPAINTKITLQSSLLVSNDDQMSSHTLTNPGQLSTQISETGAYEAEMNRLEEDFEKDTPPGSKWLRISQSPGELYSRKESPGKNARVFKLRNDGKSAMQVYEDPDQLTLKETGDQLTSKPAVLEELPVLVNNHALPTTETEYLSSTTLTTQLVKATAITQRNNDMWGGEITSPVHVILESGIYRAQTRSLDLHGFKKLQQLIRTHDDLWDKNGGQFDRLLQVLFTLLEEPNTDLTKKGGTVDLRSQVLITVRLMLSKKQKLFSAYFPRALCAIIQARQYYASQHHIIVGMEECVDQIVYLTTQEEECIEAVLETIQTTTADEAGDRLITMGLFELSGLLHKLSHTKKILDNQDIKERLRGFAVARLRGMNTATRFATVEFCMEVKDHMKEEEFWKGMSPAGSDAKALLAYYLAKRSETKANLVTA